MAAVLHVDALSTSTSTTIEWESKYPVRQPLALIAVPQADRIGEALSEAADSGAKNVSDDTRSVAKDLLRLLGARPAPQITVEPTGEISLEWYKDRHHVAVLTVEGRLIKWVAMLSAGAPAISGTETFTNQVPAGALRAVAAAT
jgi:hypothetical protein